VAAVLGSGVVAVARDATLVVCAPAGRRTVDRGHEGSVLILSAKPLDDVPQASALVHDGKDENLVTMDAVDDSVRERKERTMAKPPPKRWPRQRKLRQLLEHLFQFREESFAQAGYCSSYQTAASSSSRFASRSRRTVVTEPLPDVCQHLMNGDRCCLTRFVSPESLFGLLRPHLLDLVLQPVWLLLQALEKG